MTCGLGLGILLICIVQVERVCCSLAEGAQSFQSSNVGFPLADGLRRLGSYPQNQLRQGLVSPRSVQSSSSFSAEPAVKSGYGQGLFTKSYTQALPQPAQSSVRYVKSSLLKPNRQSLLSPRAKAPAEPKRSFGLSTDIASGSSVSQRSEKLKNLNEKGSWSAQQGTPRSNMHLSSSSRSAQSPSRERYSLSSASRLPVAESRSAKSPSGENYSFRLASLPSAARKTSHAAPSKPSNYGEVDSSAVLFGPVAPGPRERYVRMQTYARAPARRVHSSRHLGGPKATEFSSKPYAGLGSYRPMGQAQIYQPSSFSKGVYNMAFPRSSRVAISEKGFAPATVYDIPNRFGGSSIRRLTEPADQNKETVRKLQQSHTFTPQSMTPHRALAESGWSRIKVHRV